MLSGVISACTSRSSPTTSGGTGPPSLVADAVGSGIGVYALSDLVEVVEEADEDLHEWDFGPGGEDRPVRRRRR